MLLLYFVTNHSKAKVLILLMSKMLLFPFCRCAEPEFASTIAMMSIFFLQFGIIVGVNFALLLAYLIEV